MIPVLLGNSFPLSLVRRAVRIDPRTVEELRKEVAERGCISYWGHANTLSAAKAFLGFDPAPSSDRPALALNDDSMPVFEGIAFHKVWILSPDYLPGFRPDICHEVTPEQIPGWQVLRMDFTNTGT